jgi:hypothetical protein
VWHDIPLFGEEHQLALQEAVEIANPALTSVSAVAHAFSYR